MKLWEKDSKSKKSSRTCDVPTQRCQSQPTDRMFDVSFDIFNKQTKSSHEIETPSNTTNSDESNINNDDNKSEGNQEVPIRNLITGIQRSEYFAREWTYKKMVRKEPTFKKESYCDSSITSPNKDILTTLKVFGETDKCSTLVDLEKHGDIVEYENNPITSSNALKSDSEPDKSDQTNSRFSTRLDRFLYKGKDASKQLVKKLGVGDISPSKITQSEETDNISVPNEVSYYANVCLSHFFHCSGMFVSTEC